MIPTYAREYERAWRSYDAFLRLRWSLDEYGKYILERKTRYIYFPDERPESPDRRRQLTDGYRKVFTFWPNEIQYVLQSLQRTDVQRLGGAKKLARDLEFEEAKVEELMNRQHNTDREAAGGEAYERLAWLEGRRVAMGGHGV